jgi:hypothetical protein
MRDHSASTLVNWLGYELRSTPPVAAHCIGSGFFHRDRSSPVVQTRRGVLLALGAICSPAGCAGGGSAIY